MATRTVILAQRATRRAKPATTFVQLRLLVCPDSMDFIKVNNGKFNITTDFAVHGWSERWDKPILLGEKRSRIFSFLLSKTVIIFFFFANSCNNGMSTFRYANFYWIYYVIATGLLSCSQMWFSRGDSDVESVLCCKYLSRHTG